MTGLGGERLAHGDDPGAELLRGASENAFLATQRQRPDETAVRKDLHVLARPTDDHQLFGAIVVGRQLVVTDRPVFFNAVDGPFAKISGGETKRNGIPVRSASADHTATGDRDAVALIGDGSRYFPASMSAARAPRRVSSPARVPPAAPEPMTQTSYFSVGIRAC